MTSSGTKPHQKVQPAAHAVCPSHVLQHPTISRLQGSTTHPTAATLQQALLIRTGHQRMVAGRKAMTQQCTLQL